MTARDPTTVEARRGRRGTRVLAAFVFYAATLSAWAAGEELRAPRDLKALSRQLRVDLVWREDASRSYEIERAKDPGGPFAKIHPGLHGRAPAYSDFIGRSGGEYHYRVRAVRLERNRRPVGASPWSEVVKGTPKPMDAAGLLTEAQEAGFRYFYDFGHPVSALAREGAPRDRELCSSGASGMGLFNLIVGIERGFVTRKQGARRALKILRFLSGKAERFHGAFSHWLHGTTGKARRFSKYDDGADLVETAFLAQGLILLREYFTNETAVDGEIRSLADALWRGIEWDWFVGKGEHGAFLYWHWSPKYGWKMKMPIRGFTECQIVYLLALASPTHGVPMKVYREGWEWKRFSRRRTHFGVPLVLGRGVGPPLFFTHYSYLGFDPRRISFGGRTYFDHFRDLCRVQVLYAESKKNQFKGYGPLWGLTASIDPDGYKAHAPGPRDNGTITPTAALSSMPYVPDESRAFLVEMYREHGKRLWGEFGFYDAFNFSRDWVGERFLGIDVGPIAPMIENHRTGLCWRVFMKAPEVRSVVKRLEGPAEARP